MLDCGRATKDRPGPIPGLRVNMFRRCSVGEVLKLEPRCDSNFSSVQFRFSPHSRKVWKGANKGVQCAPQEIRTVGPRGTTWGGP